VLHSNSAQCQRSKIRRSSKNVEKAQRRGKEGGEGAVSAQRTSKQARVCQRREEKRREGKSRDEQGRDKGV